MAARPVNLIERRTNLPIEAVLNDRLEILEVIDVEIDWSPERLRFLRYLAATGAPVSQIQQHAHWNWGIKALTDYPARYRTLGIEKSGKMQGLMMVAIDGRLARLAPDAGQPLIYVEYLETAPWNSREFADTPIYKGVGSRLMEAAVRLSREMGFAGRVGLHSLWSATRFLVHPKWESHKQELMRQHFQFAAPGGASRGRTRR